MSPIPQDRLLAYHHGALPADEAKALARAIESDPEAQERLADWARQDAALGALYGPVADEAIPDRLRAALHPAPRPRTAPALRIAAMLALLAVGAAGGWLAAGMSSPPAGHRTLAEAAIGAHLTYVSEVIHPVEVAADDADHLTGWVSKRLDHLIAAPDFAARGFRLMGGRVLPGPDGAAAMFMYDNDLGQRVTLYVSRAGADGQTAFQFAEEGGVQSFWWLDDGLSYAVVGTVPRALLRAIALDAYDQLI